jgi:hypothetical protein
MGRGGRPHFKEAIGTRPLVAALSQGRLRERTGRPDPAGKERLLGMTNDCGS